MKTINKPVNIQIQTTSSCNANCIMCPYPESWHHRHPGIMEDETFAIVIDQISTLEINKICPYFQNDPFTDKKIFSRIETIAEHLNFNVLEISTNASGLTPQKAEQLAGSIKNLPHDIWLSFHGIDAATHEGIMGLNFDRCLTHIIHLLKISQDIALNIAIVGAGQPMDQRLAHPFNFTRKKYFQFWDEIFGANKIRRRPRVNYFQYHDRAGSIKRNSINTEEIIRPDLKGFYCPRIDQWLHFLYNGDLILCCDDYKKEQVMGNINKSRLKDILQGETYKRIKSQLAGEMESPPDFICKRCIHPGG